MDFEDEPPAKWDRGSGHAAKVVGTFICAFAALVLPFSCQGQGELNARRRQTEAIIPTIEAGSGIRLYLRTPDGNALPIHRLDDRGRETIRAMVETDRAGVSQLQLMDRDGNHVCSFQLENFLLNRFVNMDVPEPTKLTEPTSIETFAAMCGTTPEELRGAVHVAPASHTDLTDSSPSSGRGF